MTPTTAIDPLREALQNPAVFRRPHVPEPPIPEGTVTSGGFKMPVGYIAQSGVKRSRPGSIDPNAVNVFAAWIGQVVETDSDGGIPNIPQDKTGIIGYSALKNRAFPRAAGQLAIVSGNNQSAAVSTPVATPLVVAVLDVNGEAIPSEPVTFKVKSGGGSFGGNVTELLTTTDKRGEARVGSWILGAVPGENTVTAKLRCDNIQPSVKFKATGRPRGPMIGTITGGNLLTGFVGQELLPEPEVTVHDPEGNPIAGVVVDFEILTGAGTLGGESSHRTITDSAGVARSRSWTLGTAPGEHSLLVTVADTHELIFTATAITSEMGDAPASSGEPVKSPSTLEMDHVNPDGSSSAPRKS